MFPKIFGSNIDHMKADLPIVKTIRRLSKEIELSKPGSPQELQSLRKSLFGKKGSIVGLFEEFRNLPSDQKREIGIMLNDLKKTAGAKLDEFESNGWGGKAKLDEHYRDPMLPAIPFRCGSLHPLNIVRTNLLKTLMKQGFEIVTGPEIESEWHNFGALNFPANHPAREMQDTYFIKGEKDFLLRTHTSNVQIRLMTDPASPPPLKKIIPGRVYRNEVISSRSHCFFHQIEGLWVDSNVSFLDLRECLIHFTKDYFGSETRIRIRPSFFPFTEPSGEIDIRCMICKGKGCSLCKSSGWVEIAGCGLVHDNVFSNCKLDPDKFSGFAFGMGVERIAMLTYGIDDIRLFSQNDLRFLRQFRGETLHA